MIILIAAVVFLGGLFFAVAILIKKIPVLAQLPEVDFPKNQWRLFLDVKTQFLIERFQKIRYEAILQKILSRVCVLTLKVEHRANKWLQVLREREKNKKVSQADNYWDKFKQTVGRKRVRTPR